MRTYKQKSNIRRVRNKRMENLWVLLTAAETTKTLFFSFGPQMFTPAAVQYLKRKLPSYPMPPIGGTVTLELH